MDVLHPSAKGKRNLVNILDAWADRRPEKVHLSLLNNSDVQQGFRDITHREVRDAADAFAWWLYDTYGKNNSFETIAYIGTNDVRYLIVFYGAIKAGYKVCIIYNKLILFYLIVDLGIIRLTTQSSDNQRLSTRANKMYTLLTFWRNGIRRSCRPENYSYCRDR